jgi:hypothetical protein
MPPAPQTRRRWYQFGIGTMLLVIAAVGGFVGFGKWAFKPEVEQRSFEAVAWKRADPIEHHRTVRSQMVDDLLRRHNFQGWTRGEVTQLLGNPDTVWSSFNQWDIIYVLGIERAGAYSLDDEALGFKFDANDLVIAYGLSVN